MVGISSVLQFQYPTSQFGIQWRVEFDGANDHIVFWNAVLGAQPSEVTLAAIKASAPYITWNTPAEFNKRTQANKSAIIGQVTALRKASPEAFSTVNFADVAGMIFQLLPNKHYQFEFEGAYTAAAAATGLQLSVNGPASPILCRFTGVIAQSTSASLYGVGAAYDVAIAGLNSGAATALPYRLAGTISTGSLGGPFALRARSEVNASAVNILQGNWAKLSAIET